MFRRTIPWLLAPALLAGCDISSGDQVSGLTLADGWQQEIVARWQDARPDMLLLSADGNHLFVSCETRSNMLAPSLARIELASGRVEMLLYGLERADGLKEGPDGGIWLGEETGDGWLLRIDRPQAFPAEQRFDRNRAIGSHAAIRPQPQAGRFAHEGFAFSKDGRFLYLADEWAEGCLFRLNLASGELQVLHRSQGWLALRDVAEPRLQAEILHGRIFARMEDMERLPDGRILIAETGNGDERGRLWVLDDRGPQPAIEVYLEHPGLKHPDNLEWDAGRRLLWITDDSDPSLLFSWDGKQLTTVARHDRDEITGVESAPDGSIYVNIQHPLFGPELTVRLHR